MINVNIKNIRPGSEKIEEELLDDIKNIMAYSMQKEDRMHLIIDGVVHSLDLSDKIDVQNVLCRLERKDIVNNLKNLHLHYAEKTKKPLLDLLDAPEQDAEDVYNAAVKCIQEELEIRAKIYTDVYNKKHRIRNEFRFDTVHSFVFYLKARKSACLSEITERLLENSYQKMKSWSGLLETDIKTVTLPKEKDIVSALSKEDIIYLLKRCNEIISTEYFDQNKGSLIQICFLLITISKNWEIVKDIKFMKKVDSCKSMDYVLSLFQKAYNWKLPLEEQVRNREEIDKNVEKNRMHIPEYNPRKEDKVQILEEDDSSIEEDIEKKPDTSELILSIDQVETKKYKFESFLVFLSMLKSFMYLVLGAYHYIMYLSNADFSRNLLFKVDIIFLLNLALCIQSTGEGLVRGKNLYSRQGQNIGQLNIIANYAEDFVYLILFFVLMSIFICVGFPVLIHEYCIHMLTSSLFLFGIGLSLFQLCKNVQSMYANEKKRRKYIKIIMGNLLGIGLSIMFHVMVYRRIVFKRTEILNFLF